MTIPDKAYKQWIVALKKRIRAAQLKAAVSVNTELLQLYWHLGSEIIDKEKTAAWGDKIIPALSADLLKAFPQIKGFSRSNLYYIRKWFSFYTANNLIIQQAVGQLDNPGKTSTSTNKNKFVQQAVGQLPQSKSKSKKLAAKIVQQAVGQIGQQPVEQLPGFLTKIPWGHHLQIITKCKSLDEALFYINETCRNNWSRNVLVHQMEGKLYKRKGKAVTNFENVLPKPQSDLANELLKNPYQFDFLSLGAEASERDIENALTDHLTKFLLELGAGFAYLGRQYQLNVDDQDFFIDLLFYHTHLHCYVVVELLCCAQHNKSYVA